MSFNDPLKFTIVSILLVYSCSAECKFDGWMNCLKLEINGKALSELVIAGTHDSICFKKSTGLLDWSTVHDGNLK